MSEDKVYYVVRLKNGYYDIATEVIVGGFDSYTKASNLADILNNEIVSSFKEETDLLYGDNHD